MTFVSRPHSPLANKPTAADKQKANGDRYNASAQLQAQHDESLKPTARHNGGGTSRTEYDNISKHIEPLIRPFEQRLSHFIDSRIQVLEDLVVRKHEVHMNRAAVHSHYFDDLDEWLQHTGYHDEAMRKRELKQARKLAELDAQRAELIAQMERGSNLSRSRSVRAQSARPSEPSTGLKPPSVNATAPPPNSMGPPPLPSPKVPGPVPEQNDDETVCKGTKRPIEAPLPGEMPADKIQRIETTHEARNETPVEKRVTAPRQQKPNAVDTR